MIKRELSETAQGSNQNISSHHIITPKLNMDHCNQTDEAVRGRSLHYFGVDYTPSVKDSQRNTTSNESTTTPNEGFGSRINLKSKIFDVFGMIK